jgi:hypothetical protein
MAGSQGTRHEYRYIVEQTPGTTPATPAMLRIRNTGGGGIVPSRAAIKSAEFRADRGVKEFRMGQIKTKAEIPIEFCFEAFDDLLASLFQGTWTMLTPATYSTTFGTAKSNLTFTAKKVPTPGTRLTIEYKDVHAVTTTDSNMSETAHTIVRGAGSYITDGWVVGMKGKITQTGANSGATITVTQVAALTLTVSETLSVVGATTGTVASYTQTVFTYVSGTQDVKVLLATDGTGAITQTAAGIKSSVNGTPAAFALMSCDEVGGTDGSGVVAVLATKNLTGGTETLQNGTTITSLTVEDAYLDISEFIVGTGGLVGTMKLDVAPDKIVTGSFGIDFLTVVDPAGATIAASVSDVAAGHPFDSFTGSVEKVSTPIANITGLSINATNGQAPMFPLFEKQEAYKIAIGRFDQSGTMSLFFSDAVAISAFLSETEYDLNFTLTDLDGSSYKFDFPRAKYTGESRKISENDISESCPFQFLQDPTLGYTCLITRTGY